MGDNSIDLSFLRLSNLVHYRKLILELKTNYKSSCEKQYTYLKRVARLKLVVKRNVGRTEAAK